MCNNPIVDAISTAGGVRQLAGLLGLTHPAVIRYRILWSEGKFQGIPAHRAIQIEETTGISKSRCRPDLWPEPETLTPLTLEEAA